MLRCILVLVALFCHAGSRPPRHEKQCAKSVNCNNAGTALLTVCPSTVTPNNELDIILSIPPPVNIPNGHIIVELYCAGVEVYREDFQNMCGYLNNYMDSVVCPTVENKKPIVWKKIIKNMGPFSVLEGFDGICSIIAKAKDYNENQFMCLNVTFHYIDV